MPQVTGKCGHKKGAWDSHPMCLSCTHCSAGSTCKYCAGWSSTTLALADARRLSRNRPKTKSEDSDNFSGFSEAHKVMGTPRRTSVTSSSSSGSSSDSDVSAVSGQSPGMYGTPTRASVVTPIKIREESVDRAQPRSQSAGPESSRKVTMTEATTVNNRPVNLLSHTPDPAGHLVPGDRSSQTLTGTRSGQDEPDTLYLGPGAPCPVTGITGSGTRRSASAGTLPGTRRLMPGHPAVNARYPVPGAWCPATGAWLPG